MNTLISNLAVNQIVITEPNGNRIFKSYDTTICNVIDGKIKLNKAYYDKGMSKTTSKYLGLFLGVDSGVTKWLKSAIQNNLVELTNDLKTY